MAGLEGRLQPLQLRFPGGLETAAAHFRTRDGWLVRLPVPGGGAAWGEAMPLPSHGTESWEACGRALTAALPALGAAPLPRDLAEVTRAVEALPLPAWAPAARHALETALIDAAARALGRTGAAFLGQPPGGTVAVNALLGAQPPGDLAREAERAVAAGFQTLKVKLGVGPLEGDVRRLAEVRAAVGDSPRLRVDANGAWTAEEALAALEALAPFDLEFCEQPVPGPALEALAWVRARSPVPVAADEALAGTGAGVAVLAARAADVLVLRPMTLGGIGPALALAQAAEAAGVGCTVAGSLDGGAARAAAVHLAAALGSRMAAGLSVVLPGDPWPLAYRPERGRTALPDTAPGWGLEEAP